MCKLRPFPHVLPAAAAWWFFTYLMEFCSRTWSISCGLGAPRGLGNARSRSLCAAGASWAGLGWADFFFYFSFFFEQAITQ